MEWENLQTMLLNPFGSNALKKLDSYGFKRVIFSEETRLDDVNDTLYPEEDNIDLLYLTDRELKLNGDVFQYLSKENILDLSIQMKKDARKG